MARTSRCFQRPRFRRVRSSQRCCRRPTAPQSRLLARKKFPYVSRDSMLCTPFFLPMSSILYLDQTFSAVTTCSLTLTVAVWSATRAPVTSLQEVWSLRPEPRSFLRFVWSTSSFKCRRRHLLRLPFRHLHFSSVRLHHASEARCFPDCSDFGPPSLC